MKKVCEHSGIEFTGEDPEEKGYKRGYLKGHTDGYMLALEFAWNNVHQLKSHIEVELERTRQKLSHPPKERG